MRFDVTPDGRRFVMIAPGEHEAASWSELLLMLNWFEELKAKVPGGRTK